MTILSRARLETLPRQRLHDGRNCSKAAIDLVTEGGRGVVIKDVSSCPWPVRLLLGPHQLDREERAYLALRGVPGVPRLVGRIDRRAIALEYIRGRSLGELGPGDLPPGFFDRLGRLLDAIHGRGVAHGDLTRHDVLAGPGGEPFIVDFSTSVIAGSGAGPLSRVLFEQMRLADRRSIQKLRRRLVPGTGQAIPQAPGFYRAGAWLKRCIRALVRPRAYLQRRRTLLASPRASGKVVPAGDSGGPADRGSADQASEGDSR
jgi:hypothetical protein